MGDLLAFDEGERLVTVCSACHRACCWKGRFMCEESGRAGTVEKRVRELQDLALEHPGYWRENSDPDLPPRDVAGIQELAVWIKDREPKREDDASLFVSYCVTHGVDRSVLREALMPVWPEAAEIVEAK